MTITLSPEQDTAVLEFKEWFKRFGNRVYDNGETPFYIQQGYAGTGKSTILPFFMDATGLKPEDVVFCAPTGKAAKVMTKKLLAQGISTPAMTVHRAIYRPKGLKVPAIRAEIELVSKLLGSCLPSERREHTNKLNMLRRDLDRAYLKDVPNFQLNPESPALVNCKLVVVDEASMVNTEMMEDLLFFGTPILAIGDPGQLQPVSGGGGFFEHDAHNVLQTIHRQAADNPIIWASMLVREGKELPYGSHGDGQLRVLRRHEDDVTLDMDYDKQIICGTNAKRHRLTRGCRQACGIGPVGPLADEMMIVTRNSRRFQSLVNGTMLRVARDSGELEAGHATFTLAAEDEDGKEYVLTCLQKPLEENYLGVGRATASNDDIWDANSNEHTHQVDWGYAITCHKSQGSQWDNVVVHDESNVFDRSGQGRSWLYTAVTRAADRLHLIM